MREQKDSSHDFGKDLIPYAVENGHHVQAFSFAAQTTIEDVYWRDVGTVDAYYKANMELVGASPQLNLYDPYWRIWTYQEQRPPASFIGMQGRGLQLCRQQHGQRRLRHRGVHAGPLALVLRRRRQPRLRAHEVIALPECRIEENSELEPRAVG